MTNRNAQSGRVLILVLIFMLTLSAFWIIALSTTGSELSMTGSRKVAGQQFYDAEAGAAAVLDSFETNLPTAPPAAPVRNVTVTDGAKTVAQVTVRPVRNDTAYASANALPQQDFEFDPPEGSGSGVNTSLAQRYVITSEAGGRTIQVGVYRVVPR